MFYEVGDHNGAIAANARHRYQQEIQDGGQKTGSTYNFANNWDIDTIPTAKPMFSKAGNTMVQPALMSDIDIITIFKMAARKPA